ncbi:MAG: hypothetical protein ACOC16_03200 [Nanoarchaeota archaeon]
MEANKLVIVTITIIVILFLIPRAIELYKNTQEGVNSINNYHLQEEYTLQCKGFGKYCEYVFKDCSNKKKQTENECTQFEIDRWNTYNKIKDCNMKECTNDEKQIWDDFVLRYIEKKLVSSQGKNDNYELSIGENIKETNIDKKIHMTQFNIKDYSKTPYGITALGETGKNTNPIDTVSQIITDTSGTHSYGNLGLNSKGGAISFWQEYAHCLGLEGTPGDQKAYDSWKKVAKENPKELIIAEIEWYNKHIINPTINEMSTRNFPENIKYNPAVITYLSDVAIQIGDRLRNNLLDEIYPTTNENAQSYLKRLADYQSSDEYLYSIFKTYLSEKPQNIDGLKNRVTKTRLPQSQTVTIGKIDVKTQCDV